VNAHIYSVTNALNDKQYVGQTSIDTNKYGHGSTMTKAYKKYGRSNFVYERICSGINNRNTLNFIEKFWIKVMDSKAPNGYNIENGGSGSPNHKKNHIPWNKGLVGIMPSVWNKGLKTPEEVKRKQSIAKLGKPSPRKGAKHTPETIEKIRAIKLNSKMSESTKKILSKACSGYKHKQVTCQHCKTTGGITGMARWHFDNCKHKEITQCQ